MGNVRTNRSGFTLIELLFVVIIVGVLAAVATPLFGGQVQKARLSEGIAGLGTIRTAMRAELAEASVYPTVDTTAAGFAGDITTTGIGIAVGDLDGRYFDTAAYGVKSPYAGAGTFCASVDGDASGAPKASGVAGLERSINQNGDVFKGLTCTPPAINS